jgi:hypothetical protein
MTLHRVILAIGICTLLNGCHFFSRGGDCHKQQEYQRAASVNPLSVPPGLDTPNTAGALVIPAAELAPPPPGPNEACLDVPPHYKPAPTNKAGSSS